ncbi:MAG: phage baseplate protein [Bryobacteraceae bacterium]
MATTLNAATLLATWEAASAQTNLLRPLALLSAVWPEYPAEEWAARPVGQRDAFLLRLREAWFGPLIETTATCPSCGEILEVNFRTTDVLADSAPAARLEVVCDGHHVHFRLPTTEYLLRATALPPLEARQRLLQRCVENLASLPSSAIDAALRAMAEADPQADVQIALRCPHCTNAWSLAFDIVSHLWAEVDEWAMRLLHDVHRLARTYGWNEQEILTLSARRRRMYLDLIEAETA